MDPWFSRHSPGKGNSGLVGSAPVTPGEHRAEILLPSPPCPGRAVACGAWSSRAGTLALEGGSLVRGKSGQSRYRAVLR